MREYPIIFVVVAAVSISVGLQQSYYSVSEGQGPVTVCTEVMHGDVGDESFEISYTLTNGLAEGEIGITYKSAKFQRIYNVTVHTHT